MLFLVMVILVYPADAHLEAGHDREIGKYFMDFGYAPDRPVAGTRTTIAFNLVDRSQKPADIDSTWVRISDEKEVEFAGSFKNFQENTTFTYTFPRAGTYEITARFQKGGKTLAETTEMIRVSPASRPIIDQTFLFSAASLLCGVGIGIFICGIGRFRAIKT